MGDERGLSTTNSVAVACIHFGLSKWGATFSCEANPEEDQGEQGSLEPGSSRLLDDVNPKFVSEILPWRVGGPGPGGRSDFDEQSFRTLRLFSGGVYYVGNFRAAFCVYLR